MIYFFKYDYCYYSFFHAGPEGELRKYLKRLAVAESVQDFVARNPFGKPALSLAETEWYKYDSLLQLYRSERLRVRGGEK